MRDYVYIGESPWGQLGTLYEGSKPRTSKEIIDAANLNWTVGSTPMYTKLHNSVEQYHAIYVEDDAATVIGVVNRANPILIQNTETFKLVESMLGNQLDVETCGHISGYQNVFGCFKVAADYKIFDDPVDHFIVVLNNHLQVDGKITILYTPVRVWCQNTLSYALSNNMFKCRINVNPDAQINRQMCYSISDHIQLAQQNLTGKCNKYKDIKVGRPEIDEFLDDIFPLLEDPTGSHSKANDAMELARYTFMDKCMGRDDLGNYRGTGYQLFNASMDMFQHYFKSADKCYDLTYRMSLLPGQGSDTNNTSMKKTINFLDKLAAKQAA